MQAAVGRTPLFFPALSLSAVVKETTSKRTSISLEPTSTSQDELIHSELELESLFRASDSLGPEGSPRTSTKRSSIAPSSPSGSPYTLPYYKKQAQVVGQEEPLPPPPPPPPLLHSTAERAEGSLPSTCDYHPEAVCLDGSPKKRTKRIGSAPELAPPPPHHPIIMLSTPPPATVSPPAAASPLRRLDGIASWTSEPRAVPFGRSSFSAPSSTTNTTTTGHRIKVLILVPEEQPFYSLIRDVKQKYQELLENRCDFIVQVVLHDSHIRAFVLRYNPNVIVTTGAHWMQIVLSGLVEERRIYSSELQDVERMHGQILQIPVCGAIRYVFPLIGYTRRRSSSPNCSPRENISSPINGKRLSSGARRDLFDVFAELGPSFSEEHSPVRIQTSGSTSPTRTGESSTSLCGQDLDHTTADDLIKLMLFLAEQVSSLTPPGSTSGSPNNSSTSFYELMYGGRRTMPGDVIQAAASYNSRPTSGS